MQMQSTTKSPLFLDGWLEFNRVKWGVRPVRVNYSPDGAQSPTVEVVYYLNKAGKIVLPRLNPFLPIAFEPTPVQGVYKMYRQWLALAEQIVRDMRSRGVWSAIRLPPEITDIRPWQWAGFQASVRYTFCIDFLLDSHSNNEETHKRIKGMYKSGYICERTTNMMHVLACLERADKHQQVNCGVTARDFEHARELLGDESFRAYVCYGPNGEPACMAVNLHCPGSKAVDWMSGTRAKHQQSGATEFLIHYMLEDLQAADASGFVYIGATVPSIVAAQMIWGGRLVPAYIVEAFTLRNLTKWVWDKFRYHIYG